MLAILKVEMEHLAKYIKVLYLFIIYFFKGVPSSDSVDVRFVLPFFDQFFPCIPKRIRKRLYFGVPFDKVRLSKMKVVHEVLGNNLFPP